MPKAEETLHAKGIEIGIYTNDVKTEAGLHTFTVLPEKWTKATGTIGIVSKRGRYNGGTYAHLEYRF